MPLSSGVCLRIEESFSSENDDSNDNLRAQLSIWGSREKSRENRLLAGYSKENVRKAIGLGVAYEPYTVLENLFLLSIRKRTLSKTCVLDA